MNKMYKRKPIFPDQWHGSKVYLFGGKKACQFLSLRMLDGIICSGEKTEDYQIDFGNSSPHGKYDQIIVISDDPDHREIHGRFKGQALLIMSTEEVYSLTHSQEKLSESDWMSIRDMENEFISMHEKGVWTLSDDVVGRFKERKQHRIHVDSEMLTKNDP